MFSGAGADLKGLRVRGMWGGRRWSPEGKGFSHLTSSHSTATSSPSLCSERKLLRPTITSSSSSGQLDPHFHLIGQVNKEMPGTLPRFPSMPRGVTMPTLLNSLPRGINPPSLPRGITMPSLPTLPSLPSMPRGVTMPSLPRGMSLPRAVAMSTVSQAPRRLLQDCCSVLDHQTPGGNGFKQKECFHLTPSSHLIKEHFQTCT